MAFSSAGSSPKLRPWSVHLRPADSPIGRAPLAILRRQQPGRLFMKPGRLGEAQACGLDPGLCAHQVRLLAPLIGRAFPAARFARTRWRASSSSARARS